MKGNAWDGAVRREPLPQERHGSLCRCAAEALGDNNSPVSSQDLHGIDDGYLTHIERCHITVVMKPVKL